MNVRPIMLVATILVVGASVPLMSQIASRSGAPTDNQEVKRLRDEDQADRVPNVIVWSVVAPRDHARLKRVVQLFEAGDLQTATDYVNAALVLQHGDAPEDSLLAHELCVAAMMLGKNDLESSSLAAAAEDRFLMKIARPQRFGTQYRSEGGAPLRLHTVDNGVTDQLRRLMGEPSLAEAKAQEMEFKK